MTLSSAGGSRSHRHNGGHSERDVEIRILKDKVRSLTKEKISLQKELEYYKNEITKLLSPPYIEAVVLEVIDDNRVVVKSSTGPNLIVNVAAGVDARSLKPGAIVALNNRGSTIVDVLPGRYDPLVKAMEVEERPKVFFKDVGGLEEQIREIYEAVVLPIKNPHLFRELGIDPPKGVLLHGPPGTGKTLLAKAVAGETEATFIRVVGSELVNKFIGEGARLVREIFRLAREKAPSILFIDEIDAIASKRVDIGTSGDREVQRTMLQLLAELDGFDPLDNVKVIAATNRLDLIDPAVLRPGRFDRIIEVPLPSLRGRLEILGIHTRKAKMAPDVDLEAIAKLTEGFSGADLKAVVVEAGYNAIRRGSRVITMDDMIKAVEKVKAALDKRGGGDPFIRAQQKSGDDTIATVI
ncbi:proteasome-activating nucleotidase [Aeropyrum pernix K1]|uniref:Proteasome-activating nucleotidase n=1 Tax=Aeropyrum pernix (strain ATCC 700893 / DSM 11879 / JCM 9820 / NBRC 100138 / K1) TaxID=272557 RepID=PAN_AERPE|nr:proteasome-activating nucleotidase [Aeropyrum pernix]Q9YAC7.1 RecName: Full=Proteasome-activating nucleotidase; Short=PAN; AltName: Full=Proteasomal ATPase; AltName: Full=Proteasome regulatory ATPase; AltName: Full=Proteasome regulatory particle [Aeropyrum pernix K1]BAA81022.1 proteasome-activating nucleotidase [Aeropyrum pernix K1]